MKTVILETPGYGNDEVKAALSLQALEQLGDVTFYGITPYNKIVDRCKDAEIVIINKCRMDAAVISQLPRLKYIGVLATGYNVVDLASASEHGVVVTNIPAYSTDSVAQMVWAHILNIVNKVAVYAAENSQGKWCASDCFHYLDEPYMELAGKQIGIVGLGNIGMAVARIALAFGMKVAAFTSKKADALPAGIRSVPMDELFSTSDIVSLHCPLTESTRELVNAARLQTMKPTAILINTGRGPLVNEADLAAALRSGRLKAYGADVLSQEPPAPSNPLVGAPNCYLTPHIAWATVEAQQRLIEICAANVRAFLSGHPQNQVN